MLFKRTVSALYKNRLKKPTVYFQPALNFNPLYGGTQAQTVEHGFYLLKQHILASHTDSNYGFLLSDINLLYQYLGLYPEERNWLSRLIELERCAPGVIVMNFNPYWTGNETLIRSILSAQFKHRYLMNEQTPVVLMPHPAMIKQLPQLLKQCDIEAVLINPKNTRNLPFTWLSPDDNSICVIPYHSFNQDESIPHQAQQILNSSITEHNKLISQIIYDDRLHAPPDSHILGNSRTFLESNLVIESTGSAIIDHCSAVSTLVQDKNLLLENLVNPAANNPVSTMLNFLDLKRANRLLEIQLFETEFWLTLANLLGSMTPIESIQQAWDRLLVVNQYSALTEEMNELAFLESLSQLHHALQDTIQIKKEIQQKLASVVNTKFEESTLAITLFHSLPWRTQGVINAWFDVRTDTIPHRLIGRSGEDIPYEIQNVEYDQEGNIKAVQCLWVQKDLPACGHMVVNTLPSTETTFPYIRKSKNPSWIENDFYRIEVNTGKGGGIARLYDKELNKELIQHNASAPANDVVFSFRPTNSQFEVSHEAVGEDFRLSQHPADLEYQEGAVTKRLFIRGQGPYGIQTTQEICLYHDLPYIDCTTIIENYRNFDEHHPQYETQSLFYSLEFPFNLTGVVPVFEDYFYARTVPKHIDGSGSRVGLQPFYRWLDLSWSFCLCIVDDQQIQGMITLELVEMVRPKLAADIYQPIIQFLAKEGVTCHLVDIAQSKNSSNAIKIMIDINEQDSEVQRLIHHHPEATAHVKHQLSKRGYDFVLLNDTQQPDKIVLVIQARDEKTLQAAIADLIQSTINHSWHIPQSVCFLSSIPPVIDDVGMAMVSSDIFLAGLQEPSTLRLGLMQSSCYKTAATHWYHDYANEHARRFHYRFLPHSGNWRDAEIPRQAMEYDHPANAVLELTHEGTLATKQSFFAIEPSNILVSSVKPLRSKSELNPLAKPSQSAIFRLYDAHGEETNLYFESNLSIKKSQVLKLNETPRQPKRDIAWEDQFIRTLINPNEILSLQISTRLDVGSVFPAEPSSVLPNPKNPSDHESDETIKSKPSHSTAWTKPFPMQGRYWRFNNLAGSEFGQGLSVILRGKLEPSAANRTIDMVDVVLVNHQLKNSINGELEVSVPAGWRAIPQHLKFKLDAGGYSIQPLQVIYDQPRDNGFLKVVANTGTQVVEDMMHIGPISELGLEMTLIGDLFQVILNNDYDFELQGFIEIIGPIESWQEPLVADASLTVLSPQQQVFLIGAKSQQIAEFILTPQQTRFIQSIGHHWTIVKIAYHHTVRYYHVRFDGLDSHGLGATITPMSQ